MDLPKTKAVINTCFGGFSVSEVVVQRLGLNGRHAWINRTDPRLVSAVEELGKAANGKYACLKVVEIPTVLAPYFQPSEYDGNEGVAYDLASWIADRLESLTPENVSAWKADMQATLTLMEQLQ